MKKSLVFTGAAVAAFAMTGCFATHTNDAAVPVAAKVCAPFAAHVEAGSAAVSGEATVHSFLGIFNWGVSSFADDAFVTTTTNMPFVIASANEVAKQGATFNACASAKADMLLGAQYKIDIADYLIYKSVKCTVTGYPGHLNGVAAQNCSAK